MKKMFNSVISVLFIISLVFGFAPNVRASVTNAVVTDILADKAMYSPGDMVEFTIKVNNPNNSTWCGIVNVDIYHLERVIDTVQSSVSVPGNTETSINVAWTTPSTDFMGYLVKAHIGDESVATAIDCSSDFSAYPRYGYVAEFTDNPVAEETIDELSKRYHINAYQLYDWMWRHETLIKRENGSVASHWNDLFNRSISTETILDYISTIHENNANAMAYVMSYAAREGYGDVGIDPSYGLFTDMNHSSQLNVDFGNNSTYLWLFNPANTEWQNIMVDQYKDAINTFGFDGLQMDQMGQRNNVFDYRGRRVYLEDTFSSLVNQTKKELTANNPNKNTVTFNIVDGTANGWAMDNVTTKADTDFDFSEIWWLSDSYNDIKNYIEQVRDNNGGKALVLAAYMNYRDLSGDKYEAENASLSNVSTNTDHYGFSGSGFVDGFEAVGDSITFNITAPEDGLYSFDFTYANAAVPAVRKVYVDNVIVDQVSFGVNSSWDTWAYDASCSAYLTQGNHSVKLSYENDCYGAINVDCLTLGEFDENSIRLADAAFAASGAQHIELGADKDVTMLGHEYYPMKAKSVRNSLKEAMKNHYDFITAYENLLFSPEVKYADTGLQYLSINGENISGNGESGTIWYIGRHTDEYSILHLINLSSENDNMWRNTTATPTVKSNLETRYYIDDDFNIDGVYLASPDYDSCLTTSLDFSIGYDGNRKYVAFTVPKLEYWDMIYIKRSIENITGKYEAEAGVRSGVSTNTDHYGYTGAGFVDGFDNVGDSVGFTIVVPEDGKYTLSFRYANSIGDEATRSIIVDGKKAKNSYFANLSDWNTWANSEVGVELKKGVHSIVVYYGYENHGAINLDSLTLKENEESARSLYMNNWNNLVAIWKDTFINQAAPTNNDGPSLYELRYYDGSVNGNYNTNLIRNYSTFLKDTTSGIKYTSASEYTSTGYFDQNGILINEYEKYGNENMPISLTKKYNMVPGKQFVIVEYDLLNEGNTSRSFSILDMLHVNNELGGQTTASYNNGFKSVLIDLPGNDAASVAHGILSQEYGFSYQVADDTISNIYNGKCSPWHLFNSDRALYNNGYVSASDVSTAYSVNVTLAPGEMKRVYFYLAAGKNNSELSFVLAELTQHNGAYWENFTSGKYADWLNEGEILDVNDQEIVDAYKSISVFMKQSIVPGIGSDGKVKFAAFPATTNPSAYSYKVWARDSAVTAMSMDATGHLEEAEQYWYWLADRQIANDEGGWKKPGTFWTCYWIWDNGPVSFVEPEYDSIGMFLVGAYRHYEKLTGQAKVNFLNNIWPAYKRSADLVLQNIGSNGFGLPDCSIWEEQTEYNSFTEGLYVSGLDAAQYMAQAMGYQDIADMYNGGASTIRTAIMRDDTETNPGEWNVSEQRFNRAVSMDGTPNTICDSSSDCMIAYGVVDAESSRAKSHIDKITERIGHDTYGVARYENDGFYHRMPWDPGANEALEDEPSWPQMAMWIGMYEIQSGSEANYINAYNRLKWYVNRTAKGYMPQGENFSNITLKPHLSTMCEPITGAAFLMTSLAYAGKFDMRVYSPQVNAGAYKNICVSGGCAGDWAQWDNIPYYTDRLDDDLQLGSYSYDIKNVAVANDNSNIYVKIDLDDWKLPEYMSTSKFAVQVYSDGGNNGSNISISGNAMDHSMNYMLMRSNDSDDYVRYIYSNGMWNAEGMVNNAIAPQWEVNSGRIELVIPCAAINNDCSINNWNNLRVVISQYSNGDWVEADDFNLHYRMTGWNMEWLKGNFQ
jgi:GH15 family glucan-1,4-alpha-glucosidase